MSLRVVHISGGISGGAGSACYRLHSALLSKGVESTIVSVGQVVDEDRVVNYRPKYKFVSKILRKAINPDARKIRRFISENPIYEAWSWFRTYELLSFENVIRQADIIHLHWAANIMDYYDIFRRVKAPIIWSMHDMNPYSGLFHYYPDAGISDRWISKIDSEYREMKLKLYERRNDIRFVALSDHLRVEALKQLGHHHDVSLIRNTIIMPTTNDVPVSINEKYRHLEDKFVVLFVSAALQNERKGWSRVKELVEEAPKSWVFVFVGAGIIEPKENIINIGKVTSNLELFALYKYANVTLLPSIIDNLPNVMLESLCCGTPVVSSHTSGAAGVVSHEMGVILNKWTTNGAISIINMIEEGELRYDKVRIAELANMMFSPALIANQYISIYESSLVEGRIA